MSCGTKTPKQLSTSSTTRNTSTPSLNLKCLGCGGARYDTAPLFTAGEEKYTRDRKLGGFEAPKMEASPSVKPSDTTNFERRCLQSPLHKAPTRQLQSSRSDHCRSTKLKTVILDVCTPSPNVVCSGALVSRPRPGAAFMEFQMDINAAFTLANNTKRENCRRWVRFMSNGSLISTWKSSFSDDVLDARQHHHALTMIFLSTEWSSV